MLITQFVESIFGASESEVPGCSISQDPIPMHILYMQLIHMHFTSDSVQTLLFKRIQSTRFRQINDVCILYVLIPEFQIPSTTLRGVLNSDIFAYHGIMIFGELLLFYHNNPENMISCHLFDCGIRLRRIMIFCLIPHETLRHRISPSNLFSNSVLCIFVDHHDHLDN